MPPIIAVLQATPKGLRKRLKRNRSYYTDKRATKKTTYCIQLESSERFLTSKKIVNAGPQALQ